MSQGAQGGGRRRPRRSLWIGGALLCASALALAAFVHTDAARSLARRQVADALEQGLGLRADIGEVDLGSFGRELVARDVTLRHPQHGPLVVARRLRVRPSLTSLLSGHPDLRETAMEGARVTLRVRDGRVVNLPEPAADGRKGTAHAFHSLTLADAVLVVEGDDTSLDVEGVEARLEAEPDALALSLRGTGAHFEGPQAARELGAVSLQARWNGEALHVERLTASAPGVSVALSDARLPLPLGDDVTGQLHGELDLGSAPAVEALGPLAGNAIVDAELRVRAGRVQAVGTAQLTQAHVGRLALGETATVRFDASPDGLEFDAALQLEDGASAKLKGGLGFDPARSLDVEATLEEAPARWLLRTLTDQRPELDAARVTGTAHLSGSLAPVTLAGTLAMKGAPTGWTVDGDVTLDANQLALDGRIDGLTLAGKPVGELVGTLVRDAETGALRVEHARGTLGTGSYELQDVTVELAGDAVQASGAVALKRVGLRDVAALAGVDASGVDATLQGDCRIAYRSAQDGEPSLSVDTELSVSGARAHDASLGDGKLRAVAQWQAPAAGLEGLELERLELSLGEGVRVSGSSSARAMDITVRAKGLPLKTLVELRRTLPGLDGRYDVEGRVHGRPGAPLATLRWRASALSLHGRSLGPASGELTLARDDGAAPCPGAESARAALPESARRGPRWLACGTAMGDALEYALAWGRDGGRPLRGRIGATRLELEPFLGGVSGRLAGALVISDGGLQDRRSLQGHVELSSLSLSHGDVRVTSEAAQRLVVREGRVRLGDGLSLAGNDASATVSGSVGLDGSLDLALAGTLKAKRLPALTRQVARAHGELSATLAARGSLRAPVVSGTLDVNDVTLQLSSFGVPIWHLHGSAQVDGDRVSVQGIEGELGDGKLRLEGTATLAGGSVSGYDLHVTARDVALEPQRGFSLVLSADTRLLSSTDGEPPTLSGTVELGRLRYARHVELPAVLAALDALEARSGTSYRPELDAVRLDLKLAPTGPLHIHNNLADAWVRLANQAAPLRITGSDRRPAVRGALKLDGDLLFRNVRFAISHANVSFREGEPIDPTLDVAAATARTADRPAVIALKAEGDRKLFELDLTCNAEPSRPPFECSYRDQRWRCDAFAELAELWQCRAQGGNDTDVATAH